MQSEKTLVNNQLVKQKKTRWTSNSTIN